MAVQRAEIGGIDADELRSDLRKTGAHARGIRRQIGGAKRAALAVADDAGIGFYGDDGGVEYLDIITVRPAVAAFLQGQIDLPCLDGGNLHGESCLALFDSTDVMNWTVSGSRGLPITCSGGPIS